MIEPLSEIYVMNINNYLYSIDKNGNMIFTHLNPKNINNYKKYFNFISLNNEPEDLLIWNNLVKLNRSLEPKESI